jgi:hypothetical protein
LEENNLNNNNNFIRDLTPKEKKLLLALLPKNRKGYAEYRSKINSYKIIGFRNKKKNNFFLGNENSKFDLTLLSAPVFACGSYKKYEKEIYVVIHQELENIIEVDISLDGVDEIPDDLSDWTFGSYSNWMPGKKAPNDNSQVREIHIIKNKLVVVIAPIHKKVWVYEHNSGINYLIPVTNFYNEIMRIKKIKDPKIALDPNRIFSKTNEFSDEEIGQGLLLYNKYLRRINIDYSLFNNYNKIKHDKSIFSFRKKGR